MGLSKKLFRVISVIAAGIVVIFSGSRALEELNNLDISDPFDVEEYE